MDDFESWMRAIGGTVFCTLLAATITLQGELIGLVFVPPALISTMWLCMLVAKEIRKNRNAERSNENAE